MSINILQKDVSIMNTKREKYRVEIRKTYQMQELENKRFLTVKKSTLNSKKIFLLNIFTNQNEIQPKDIFKIFDSNPETTDPEHILQALIALAYYIDKWDESFCSQFYKENQPSKLIHLAKIKPINKRILEEITSIFVEISRRTIKFEELICFQDDLIIMYDGILEIGLSSNIELLNNIFFGIGNICYDSERFGKLILESGILRKIIYVFNKQDNKKLIKKSIAMLLLNILENVKNPDEIKPPHIEDLFQLCKCMFQDFIFPTTDSEAEVVEIAIFSAESLKAMAKIFDPMAIFELLEFDPSFFTKLIEILDKTEKNQHDFLCPCIDFFNDLISLEYVETSIFFKLGLLDTISILLDNKSNDKIRSKALETLASIPYEYNTSKNYESEIFLSFSNIFLEIMKGPICEARKKLIGTLNALTKNCDSTGKEIVGFFNNKEIIHSILECFEVDDMKVTSEILDLLENTLIIGVNEMARLNLTANPFALMILQDSAYKYLEEIQQNNNENISIKANTLIEDYLEGF